MTGVGSGSRDVHLPAPGESWTPIRLTRWSGEYLREKGIEAGRLEAELLLSHVLSVGRLDLYLQHDRPIQVPELDAFKALFLRRAAREPLQYILGTSAFRELELRADPRALIPRPETEVLVEEVLVWARKRGDGLTGLDVGTGTGVVALSLLKEGPFRRVVATDASPQALALALENAGDHHLTDSVEFREGTLFEPLQSEERFDVIVSNPPYVADGDRESLQPEVLDWEPHGALFAGPEGLDVLLPLVEGAPRFLNPGGLFAAEIGEGQGERMVTALEGTGAFQRISVRPDLAGRERVILGVASS